MESEDDIYLAVGRRVRRGREAAGLRQDELAERVGLTRTSITNIEKGKQRIQIHTLYAIARALSLSPRAFLPVILSTAGDETVEKDLDAEPVAVKQWVRQLLAPGEEGE